MRGRFQGMYWRQMLVTVGLVFLTLLLTAGGFLAISWRYLHAQAYDRPEKLAEEMAEIAAGYLAYPEADTDSPDTALARRDAYQQMRGFYAALLQEYHFLLCDAEGRLLVCSDENLQRRVFRLPAEWAGKIQDGQTVRDRAQKMFGETYPDAGQVSGVPVYSAGRIRGSVFVIPINPALRDMGKTMLALFLLTAFLLLMSASAASAWLVSQIAEPLGEMLQVTRQYSERDFSARMRDGGKIVEIAGLRAAFNRMAESLQLQERQHS